MQFIQKLKAKKFLKNISPKDNIAIIHHDDSDGVCSAILFDNYCKNKGAKTKNFYYHLGETKSKSLPLKQFNKIIITDISSKDIQNQLKDIKNKKIFYTDHHPIYPTPKYITAYLTAKQGYIPSSRTTYELTKGKKFLAMLGLIADSGNLYKENNSFIKKSLKQFNLTLEEFQKNYSHIFSDTLIYLEKSPQKAYKILSEISSLQEISKLKKYANKVEKDIVKTVKKAKQKSEKINGINIYKINPKYKIKGIVAAILSRENTAEPHIFLSIKTSNPKILGISARHNSDNANLPQLLEFASKNLKNSVCGGHKRASGGQVRKQDLKKFKQNLKNYVKK